MRMYLWMLRHPIKAIRLLVVMSMLQEVMEDYDTIAGVTDQLKDMLVNEARILRGEIPDPLEDK